MKIKQDVCKCGEPKQASSRQCKKCSTPGMVEALRAYQLAKFKAKYAGTDAEKVCPCGATFYAKTRKICNECKRKRRRHDPIAEKLRRHPVEAIARLRESMIKVMRKNEFGKFAFRGWRCVRCGACCTDRKCVKCEMEV